jgi:hypothetical protein
MKNPIMAGAIAGIVKGICAHIGGSFIGPLLGLWPVPPFPPMLVFLATLGFDVVWGIILAIIFSVLYNSIPGRGISKGLIYGLGIYLVSNIRAANLAYSFLSIGDAVFYAFTGIFALIPYGIVLGYLYKK